MSQFIVFEGPDGSGSTLHTRLLSEKLQLIGIDTITTKEPSDGPIGTQIRERLHSYDNIDPLDLQKMFVADREWHLKNVIEPGLDSGKIVISDRYFHSTICYGQALGLGLDMLKNLNKDFMQPNLTFFLLPSLEVCKERMGRREKHDSLEEDSLQQKVYEYYKKMAQEDESIKVIDNSGEKEKVADEIFAIAEQELKLLAPST